MKKLERVLGIIGHKVARPAVYKRIYGINQLSACNRDGNYDSWDFVGTINEVIDYEKRWCNNGTNGFSFLGLEVVTGFKGQFKYCGK